MTDDQKPIPRRLRFEILRRDGHTCRYCGAQAPDVPLTVDHVIPRVLGGSDDPNNLVTACRDCNAGKTSIAPDQQTVEAIQQRIADVDAASLLFGRAMERAAELIRDDEVRMRSILQGVNTHWERWGDRWRANDWESSVRRFAGYGLNLDELKDAIDVAMQARGVNSRWNYFCGVCWRRITERQELARRLIEDGQV